MRISLFERLFAKHQKNTIDFIGKGPLTLIFGDSSWRIKSEPVDGKSHLKLFADDNIVFEGSYKELIERLNINKT